MKQTKTPKVFSLGKEMYRKENSSNLDTALIVRKHYSVRNMTALILS